MPDPRTTPPPPSSAHAENPVRSVGRRVQPVPELRRPTPDQIAFLASSPAGAPRTFPTAPRGTVRRYRSHEEANEHMEELIGDRMAAQAARITPKPR